MVLLTVTLVPATGIPRMIAYGVVAVVYISVLVACYVRGELTIAYSRPVLYLTGALWAVFLLAFVLNPTPRSLLRTGAFIVFSGIVLFVIPGTFSQEEFFDSFSILATVVGGMALPLAAPAILFGGSEIGVWSGASFLAGTVIDLPALTSVFWNPNYLAAFSALGLIATLGFAREVQRQRFAAFCGIVCLSALLLSQGRAAFLAALGGVVLYIAFRAGGTRLATPLVIVGVVGSAVFFVLIFVSVFGVSVPVSLLNNRGGLWTAAVAAIGERPVLGWGLINTPQVLLDYGAPSSAGTHNSYLRMFLMTGIVGGILYLAIVGVVLYRTLQAADRALPTSGVILSLLGVIFTLQLFNGSTLFGLSLVSLLSGIIVGYAQQPTSWIAVRNVLSRSSVRSLEKRITDNS